MTGRVAVVGGGIAGLTAAWFAQRAGWSATVFEGSPRVGGKLWTAELAGAPFDVGADAFLSRQPDFVELCDDLGLADDLIAPATGQVWLWFRDGLRRLPARTVMGIPSDLQALESSGVLSPVGLSVARSEGVQPPPNIGPDEDPELRPFIVERFGAEVADRLVDPLLSGVYAGDIARLGLRSATPVLAALVDEAQRRQTPLQTVLASRRQAAAKDDSPVFNTVRGGLGRVAEALATRVPDVRTDTPVRAITREDGRWTIEGEAFDRVIVATPADAAAELLWPHAPTAANALAAVRLASPTVISFAWPAGTRLPSGSGMLVPQGEGRLLKAATWSTQKWPHLAERDEVLLRCSTGRIGDDRALAMKDADLVAAARAELAEAVGIETPPLDVVVTRWHRALPQYDSGHLASMAGARDAAAEAGVLLAGSAHEGVGLPACVRSARAAVDVLTS